MKDAKTVTLHIVIKGRDTRLGTLQLPERSSLWEVKKAIVDGNRAAIAKQLNLKEEQCIPRMILPYIGGAAIEENNRKQLKTFGMRGGSTHSFEIQISRVHAFLSTYEFRKAVERLDQRCRGEFPKELIKQAIFSCDDYHISHVWIDLYTRTEQLFEKILAKEAPRVDQEVARYRAWAQYPLTRVRYKIIGEPYRRAMIFKLRETHPAIAEHMRRRKHFVDYLLRTDIFNCFRMDDRDEALFNSEDVRLRGLVVERRFYDKFIEADKITEHSANNGVPQGERLLELTTVQAVQDELFSLSSQTIDEQVFQEDEGDEGYHSEPSPVHVPLCTRSKVIKRRKGTRRLPKMNRGREQVTGPTLRGTMVRKVSETKRTFF